MLAGDASKKGRARTFTDIHGRSGTRGPVLERPCSSVFVRAALLPRRTLGLDHVRPAVLSEEIVEGGERHLRAFRSPGLGKRLGGVAEKVLERVLLGLLRSGGRCQDRRRNLRLGDRGRLGTDLQRGSRLWGGRSGGRGGRSCRPGSGLWRDLECFGSRLLGFGHLGRGGRLRSFGGGLLGLRRLLLL